ncbi:Protein detoxification 25 [Vitis vinifera]|uniref:Protein detoxification 25 n=1 Tax=Vitis vinifera TaxID=29760 RepID=A0A438HZC3_VITVI|nr:Protein detoxification 25 [Vitis vinifera]
MKVKRKNSPGCLVPTGFPVIFNGLRQKVKLIIKSAFPPPKLLGGVYKTQTIQLLSISNFGLHQQCNTAYELRLFPLSCFYYRIMDNNMEERLLSSEADSTSNLKGRIWDESKKMWRVAFPAILTRVTSYGMLVVTQSFVGHISQLDLSGYALMLNVIIRFVNGILLGMSSATETLCGQAFGAKQYHMMDDIAIAAGNFSLWLLPILYSFVFSMTIQMYLQAQLKNMIIGWLSASSFVLHVLLSWIFVIKLNLGIPGAMGALIISSWSMIIGEFIYIFGGWCPQTWSGFSKAAFSDILPVVKLSISSGFMLW